MDSRATAETRALFANLRRLAGTQVMFGHQDDLAYGYRWVNEPGRSDVKEVAGSYPAVYGWDLGNLETSGPAGLDGVRFDRMRGWVVEAFGRGGVITLSWHMTNPASGGNAWDTTRVLPTLLPGGTNHAKYRQWLDRFAEFALSLRAPGTGAPLVPVVFRPFHEMSGSWFWWGAKLSTPDEFKRLWRFTVEYVRDVKQVHNLLYAYSPNAMFEYGPGRYEEWYPGDSYVDVMGLDQYYWPASATWAPKDQVQALASALTSLGELAASRGKIAALTETGYETIPDSTYWTGKLLAAITATPAARRIAWVLVWRNANREAMGRDHFYAPFAGHPSAADFVRFRADPLIAFEADLPNMYRAPRNP